MLDNRIEFVSLVAAGEVSVSELCRRFGISRKTGYKWLDRAEGGPPGAVPAQPLPARLEDRSRRPLHSPGRTGAALESQLLKVREAHPTWGGRKIAHVLARDHALEIAPSTVTHVLRRHGLIGTAASEAATAWQRFEHERPNSLWQMDFKGHFQTDSGRCHPLTILDDHSRFSIVLAACPDERRGGVQAHLQEVFSLYGLPERINTDNGSPWGQQGRPGLTSLGAWLVRLGVKVSFSTPLHPQTNGKAERFHRTMKADLLQRRFVDLPQAQTAFDEWRTGYNFNRPHQAIGMLTPAQRYAPSPRSLPSVLPTIEYGPDDLVRKVQQGGWISLRGRDLRVSKALIGHPVALRPCLDADGLYDLYFCHQKIDQIDLREPRG